MGFGGLAIFSFSFSRKEFFLCFDFISLNRRGMELLKELMNFSLIESFVLAPVREISLEGVSSIVIKSLSLVLGLVSNEMIKSEISMVNKNVSFFFFFLRAYKLKMKLYFKMLLYILYMILFE